MDVNQKVRIEIYDDTSTRGTVQVIDYEKGRVREKISNPDKIVILEDKISINFRYPLSVQVAFEFENKGGFTRMDLFRCIYEGYKKIYDEEKAEVGDPGTYDRLYNRRKSEGKYGIWGHYLDDLWVEGILYNPKEKSIDLQIGS